MYFKNLFPEGTKYTSRVASTQLHRVIFFSYPNPEM